MDKRTEEIYREDLYDSLMSYSDFASAAADAVHSGSYALALTIIKRGTSYDFDRRVSNGYGAWEDFGVQLTTMLEELNKEEQA